MIRMAISPRFAMSIFCKRFQVYHLGWEGLSASFRLLAASLLLILTVPRMAQPGMFSDGVVYASIARNMAEGHGSFWTPEYTKTVYPVFNEHPPLGFGLESIFFRVFGDHPFVERVYSLLFALIAISLIVLLWRLTGPDPRGDWLPLLFWLLPSVVTWSVVNNMLENTQAVFTTAAVLGAVTAMTMESPWIVSALAGVAVGAAVLTKGPVGLFPLAVPALYALVVARERRGRALVVTAIMLVVLAIVGWQIWAQPWPRAYLQAYLHAQLMPSLSGQREVATSHWRFVELVGLDIVARMTALVIVIWALTARARRTDAAYAGRNSSSGDASARTAIFFLCVGLSASLPIAISPKMMGHYLVPSVPMFAMAGALFVWPWIASATGAWRGPSTYLPGAAGGLMIVGALALPFVRGPLEERDVTRLAALDLIGSSVPVGAVVRTCPEVRDNWPLHAYLQRFFHVSLDPSSTPRTTFLRMTDRPCEIPKGCVLLRFADDLEIYACGGT